MLTSGWPLFCTLLMLTGSSWGLKIYKCEEREKTCSSATHGGTHGMLLCSGPEFSGCTVENDLPPAANDKFTADILQPKVEFQFCCGKKTCELCLVIEATLNFAESIRLCYNVPNTWGPCKVVELLVHRKHLTGGTGKVSMVIQQSEGFPFGVELDVTVQNQQQKVSAPDLLQVCSHGEWVKYVPACHAPSMTHVLNYTTNQMELHYVNLEKTNDRKLSLCFSYEAQGRCQKMNEAKLPLYSVMPCTCFKAKYDFKDDEQECLATVYCPFTKEEKWQKVMLTNVTLAVGLMKDRDGKQMLQWNITAPCRLEGEVQLCGENKCKNVSEKLGMIESWKQNHGHWKVAGAFLNIDALNSNCVKMNINGITTRHVCSNELKRGRWYFLMVACLLLVCLAGLAVYLLHGYAKKWAQLYRPVGRKGHVLLLSPPDLDEDVSVSVCRLGSSLRLHGFSVSVDEWDREEQNRLGPQLWLYSQKQKIDSMGGHFVLVLTQRTRQRIEAWTLADRNRGDNNQTLEGPYFDVFLAFLCLISEHKQRDKRTNQFFLATFDPDLFRDKGPPELLRGLPLFYLPTQTQSLVSELTVMEI